MASSFDLNWVDGLINNRQKVFEKEQTYLCAAVAESLVKAVERRMREPWREYCSYRPDDMPPKNGSPEKLVRLMADPECGYEEVT